MSARHEADNYHNYQNKAYCSSVQTDSERGCVANLFKAGPEISNQCSRLCKRSEFMVYRLKNSKQVKKSKCRHPTLVRRAQDVIVNSKKSSETYDMLINISFA